MPTPPFRVRLLAGVAVLLLLGAACGKDDANGAGAGSSGSGATTGTTTSSSTGDDGAMGGYGGGNDGATGEDSSGSKNINVTANNFSFDPAEVEVETGEDIHVKNGNANTPHTFTVDGTDIDLQLAPLAVEETTVDLDPGSYDFHCSIHPQMTGTLTVTRST